MLYRRGAVRGNVAASNFMTTARRRLMATGWSSFVAAALRTFVPVLLGKSHNGADQ
jgi:hypothetical protein